MAEEERQWLQRHTHESNIISYGTIGRATYDQQGKIWTFSCELDGDIENDDFDETTVHSPLRLLNDDAEVVLQKSRVAIGSTSKTQDVSKLARRIPQLAAGFETVRRTAKLEETKTSFASVNQLFDFGGAAWLQDVDDYYPAHLSIPITASVVGEGGNTLRLASVTQKVLTYATSIFLDHNTSVNITPSIYIPSFASEDASTWSSTEPILQVLFSSRHYGGHSNTFLAVRQASQVIIFQPSQSGALDTSSRESIQPQKLISIDISATGGHSHADVAFHPDSRWRIAVIDVEGNWSIWHLQGRRSRTARVLYHAQLAVSGKIFSWTYRKRPDGIGLYYDGWHRLLWLSSTGSAVDRLLVCNRQTIKLFDLNGNEVCSIDARLDKTKAFSYIVDVKNGPITGLFLILTTTKLLMFDIMQKEWRDIGKRKGPALLCAWYHYYNQTDLSLNMSTVARGDDTLIALHSNRVPRLRTYQLKIAKVDGTHSVVSSSPTSVDLPVKDDTKIIRLLLASVEAKPRQKGRDIRLPQFIQVVLQHEDLSVDSILGIWRSSESMIASDYQREPMVKLPPHRDSRLKSEYRVDVAADEDDENDEDDLAGFVVPDLPVETEPSPSPATPFTDDSSKTVPFSMHMPMIANYLTNHQHAAAPSTKSSISKAFKDLGEALQEVKSPGDRLVSRTISELFIETPRLDDAEDDSVILFQAIEDLAQQISNTAVISSIGIISAPPLADTYEELFDRNVSILPPSMSNRARIQREWIVREIALDLKLSNHHIRRQVRENDRDDNSRAAVEALPSPADPNVLSSGGIIFSDPLQAVENESICLQTPNVAHISASQPEPRMTMSEPMITPLHVSPATSQLQNTISRLSNLTTIPTLPTISIPESAEEHITDLLSHLPKSLDSDRDTDVSTNPTHYDWATAELNSASLRAPNPSTLSTINDLKAKRKAERLAKARRRAEEIRREVERDQERRSVVPTIVSSQFQPPDSASAGGRHRGTSTLVYRTSPARPKTKAKLALDLPTLSTPIPASASSPAMVRGGGVHEQRERERRSQPQPRHHAISTVLSDAVTGSPESSSQAQRREGERDMMPATQPERGVFGARMRGVGLAGDQEQQQQRKKKKKVVVPGFG